MPHLLLQLQLHTVGAKEISDQPCLEGDAPSRSLTLLLTDKCPAAATPMQDRGLVATEVAVVGVGNEHHCDGCN
jgi:hypothetical protein